MCFETMEPNGSWTLVDLTKAFVDLALVYFLLSGSILVFLASKFLNLFGLFLPCPCNGIFGYRNRHICWHRLLLELPRKKIQHVKMLVWSRFPFDSIWYMILKLYRYRRFGNEDRESEGESCSRNVGSREYGFDVKGKKIIYQRQKSMFRHRKRAALEYSRRLSLLSSDNSPSICTDSGSQFSDNEMNDSGARLGPVNVSQNGLHGELNSPHGRIMVDKSCSLSLHKPFGDNEGRGKDSFTVERYTTYSDEKTETRRNEAQVIEMLQEALEEEKVAGAALYLELEKERAAAATAAEQAMFKMSRLQEDKALLEMETRQYQRMIEARFAHEEEEMDILKDILISREMDIYSLEKEVETYRKKRYLNEQVDDGSSNMMEDQGSSASSPLTLSKDSTRASQGSIQVSENSIQVSENSSNDHGLIEKNVVLSATEKKQKENTAASKGIATIASQIYSSPEKCLPGDEKWRENDKQPSSNEHNSVVDIESTVYDVHVVNEKK